MRNAVNLNQLPAELRAVARRAGALAPALRAGKLLAVANVKARFDHSRAPDGTPWPPLKRPRPRGRGADKPLLDRGLLRAGIAGRSDDHSITVGTAAVQAPLQQFGGVVSAKRTKFLAIPLTREAVRAGSPLRFPRPLSPVVGKRGGVLIERRARKSVAHFALTKRVRVPARTFLGWSAAELDRLRQLVTDYVLGSK